MSQRLHHHRLLTPLTPSGWFPGCWSWTPAGGTSYYRLSGPSWGFSSGSAEKKLPAKQETQKIQVGSLGQEDALEEGMVTHSSILGWRISRIEEAGGLQSMGSQSQTWLKWLNTSAASPALNLYWYHKAVVSLLVKAKP